MFSRPALYSQSFAVLAVLHGPGKGCPDEVQVRDSWILQQNCIHSALTCNLVSAVLFYYRVFYCSIVEAHIPSAEQQWQPHCRCNVLE